MVKHSFLVVALLTIAVLAGNARAEQDCCDFTSLGNPYLCYSTGNCTWWAWYKRPDLPAWQGNAKTWLSRAQDAGIPTGSDPLVGSIACFNYMYPPYGHVAFVRYVHTDGSFWVSEMGYNSWNCVRFKRYSSGSASGFIYGGPVPFRQTRTPTQLINTRRSTPLNDRNQYGYPNSPNAVFGNSIGSVGWYHQYTTSNQYNTNGTAKNCYRAIYTNGNAAIVYDALGGARFAYCVGWSEWTRWDNLAVNCGSCPNPPGYNGPSGQGGPNSCLGMPITNRYKYTDSPISWRQDFQKGYIKNGSVYCYSACSPGWASGNIWNSRYSYLFADAYDRNGGARDVGNAINNVHVLSGNILIQDFSSGNDDAGMIMYDQLNWDGNECATNEAYWVYGTIKSRYDANGAVGRFGCATIDRFPYGGKWCQDFKKGNRFYRIYASGSPAWVEISPCHVSGKISIDQNEDQVKTPKSFALHQNYPNPFNPQTTISYSLPEQSHVTLTICNILGEKVAILVDEQQEAGEHEIQWNASDYSSGIYFYCLKVGQFVETKKMVLLK